jgi:hypothetical protein
MRTGKLNALQVARAMKARKPRMLNDGGGLYLQEGSSWLLRYKRDRRSHYMGLGPAFVVTLAEAREAML